MELAENCENMVQACEEGIEWTNRNEDVVRNEKEGLVKELRRARRLFRRCSRAANRKMCAGVFGPSQAGKSYLISALARAEDNSLNALFGNEKYDFISEINPEGGKESTGLVTRFTMTRPQNLPDVFPVQLRLLSETDIVKILANTYFADCELKAETVSNIGATMKSLAQKTGGKNGVVGLDELEDLREYLSENFRSRARVQELENNYWEQALAIGPELGLEDRIKLYALIWDEVEEFTDLLGKLLRALAALGNADEAFCAVDALVPRDSSIIDVATLDGLGHDGDGELEIIAKGGKKIALSRALVTALTAELTVVMEKKPADYFDYTDLLDFPGYRSRYKFDDVRRELKKPGMLKEMFLRGKVAYLFQRYSAEKELTSMLLCIGPSNQEVQDLPGVINAWIAGTHGARPEDRVGKPSSLFFVLTKFDLEFEDKKGAPSLESRWDNRLHASLLDFFGKQYDWPAQWTPGEGFKNLFFLRNPNFRFDSVLDYSGDRESGIRPERSEYVEKLHSAFMGSDLVRQHFKDPEKAWEEAMRLNDGGISWIRQNLLPLCDPEIKRRQLEGVVEETRMAVSRRLAPFWQPDDREELRKQKLLFVHNLFGRLGELEETQKRLGQLLREFTISDSEIFNMYPEARRRYMDMAENENEPEPAKADTAPPDVSTANFDDWNPFAKPAQAPQSNAPKTPKMDEAAFFASYIESKWVEYLHKLADNPALQKFYMLPEKDFSSFVSELSTGAARLGIQEKMTESFRRTAAYVNTRKESIVLKQAAIAAEYLNRYVNWLGFNPHSQDSAERTIKTPGGKNVVVFEPPSAQQGGDIGEQRSAWTEAWFRDWLNALAGLIMDNVNFDGSQTFNTAENASLGNILRKLAKDADNAR